MFVCLPRAGSSLFTGESHPETQALFRSGLSQVEESIKPPDQGKGRHSGRREKSSQRRGAGQLPCSGGRRGPAWPCLRSGSAAASASCSSCLQPGPTPGRQVSPFPEKTAQPWAGNRPCPADRDGCTHLRGAPLCKNLLRAPSSSALWGSSRGWFTIVLYVTV